ncbi:ATP-binding protein, partial [Streptomyces sp. DT225]
MTSPGHPDDDPNLRHLLARATAVEQRVRRAVEVRQRTDPDPEDEFRGLYLSDENIARLLNEEGARGFPDPVGEEGEAAGPSRLTALETEFGLTRLDTEILL